METTFLFDKVSLTPLHFFNENGGESFGGNAICAAREGSHHSGFDDGGTEQSGDFRCDR